MKKAAFVLGLLFVSMTAYGQRATAEPVAGAEIQAGRPVERSAPATITTVRRGEFQIDGALSASIVRSSGSRIAAGTPIQVTRMRRDVLPSDLVHIVLPKSYSMYLRDGSFIRSEYIEYVWEVLDTGLGPLIAVPVPIVDSLGRAPEPCDCPGYSGRCSYLDFCWGTLPLDKCVITPMEEKDTTLPANYCITAKKSVESGPTAVNFATSYQVSLNGREVTVAIFGKATGQAVQRRVWASDYREGVGCFLEDVQEIGPADLQGSRFMLQELTKTQTLQSDFERGIKEQGIR